MNEKEHKRVADVEEARTKLLECFPGSLIRDSDNVGYEFIAHPRTNQSFILEDCHYVEDGEAADSVAERGNKAGILPCRCYRVRKCDRRFLR